MRIAGKTLVGAKKTTAAFRRPLYSRSCEATRKSYFLPFFAAGFFAAVLVVFFAAGFFAVFFAVAFAMKPSKS